MTTPPGYRSNPIAAAVALGAVIFAGPAGEVRAQVTFQDLAAARGIGPYETLYGKGGGVAAADFDDDGDVDLFVPTATGVPNQLYMNEGGSFVEIAADVGLDSLDGFRSALWFDFDGDHRLDLFLAGDCWNAASTCPDVSTLRLYRQDETGLFEDVTIAAGLTDDLIETTSPHRGGACAGDVNGDGHLDLVTGLWQGSARLFLNTGAGSFTDASVASGIGAEESYYWQPMMHDFDGDGWLDVYDAVDFDANRFWINRQDGTFDEVSAAAGAANDWNDMGLSLGDYDNDGDLDIYITNITTLTRHNVLYRNDSAGDTLEFLDVSETLGVASGGWGWGCTFLDADRDGWLDIAATNGWFSGGATADPSRFYLNGGAGAGPFTDVSDAVGFNDRLWGSSLVAADLDRDGDLDLVQVCNGSGLTAPALRLLDNEPGPESGANHYLVVKPRMGGPNHRALGAVVRVTAGGLNQMRLIHAGTSFCGQEPAEAFFGMGAAAVAEEIRVEWPGGATTVLADVPVDRVIVVVPQPADLNGDGAVDVLDLLLVVLNWGPCAPAGPCPGDADGDGTVGVGDLVMVITLWG